MKIFYFISDSHFGLETPEQERLKQNRLFSFFDYISNKNSRLFIVGDFFDMWFEYKNAIPNAYFQILVALSKLAKAGVEIDFIAGNHDYWVCNFFQQEFDVRIHQKPAELMLHGKRFFIAHGDGLLKDKPGSVILSYLTKNPLNIFLYRQLPPDIALPIAFYFSKLSRSFSSQKVNHSVAAKRYEQFALKKLEEGFDGIIMGHTHQPNIAEYGEKVYLNTGDWMQQFSYGMLNNGHLSLHYWDPDKPAR